MILFLDTEFTGLNQPKPELISIGLISDDGQQSFYAELTPDCYIEQTEPWVKSNVLPLLEGGECVLQPDELRVRLTAWLKSLGPAKIAVDFGIDFEFLREVLIPWPVNVEREPIFIAGSEFVAAVESIYADHTELRRHHALDDAKANKMGWLAKQNTE